MLLLDQERLAEALAIGRLHGNDASVWIASRTNALAVAGDAAGIERVKAIAEAYDRLRGGTAQ